MRSTLELGGRRISLVQAGEGEPLVFVHAFPLGAAMWERQLEALPAGWWALAPDLPGFGESTPLAVNSLDRYVDDLLAVLDRYEIRRAVFAGLSMGGYVLFALHRRAPERIRALVLADTRAGADSEEGRANRRHLQELTAREGAAGVAREMLPKLLAPETTARQPSVVAEVERIIRQAAPEGIHGALEAMMHRRDSTPLLPTITCPVLIVVGAEDRLTPVAESEIMQRGITGTRLASIPAAGHLSNMEGPETFNRELWDFLSALA